MRERISYFYDPAASQYHYGPGHPMKPHRLALTHELVREYGLLAHMSLHRPRPATAAELALFHSPEYVEFLRKASGSEGCKDETAAYFNIGLSADCPVFGGMYDFCRSYAGASIDGARQLAADDANIVINWSGGLHHAKRVEASGFCYVNDIVLAIRELLLVYPRVLYIDIDVHHGDGVQEAFYGTDRVMTLSFHKYGDGFFPGTGDVNELGTGPGRYYSLNVPLKSGIDDAGYAYIFRPVVAAAVADYHPSAIVLQCGADSLAGDRLGCFNLSIHGHGSCVDFVRTFDLPLLVLGGGGYTIRNVSRCWAYETALLCRQPVANTVPPTCLYREYFAPDYRLHLDAREAGSNIDGNQNSRSYLDTVKASVLTYLRRLQGAPSVQMQLLPRLSDFQAEEEKIDVS